MIGRTAVVGVVHLVCVWFYHQNFLQAIPRLNVRMPPIRVVLNGAHTVAFRDVLTPPPLSTDQ